MRAKTFLGAVALGIAGLALTAPMANAAGKGSIGVDQDLVGRGDTIMVHATCDVSGLKAIKLQSESLEPTTLFRKEDGAGGSFRGYAKVRKDAVPGSWPIFFECGGTDVATDILVKGMRPLEDPGPYGDHKTTQPKTTQPKPATAKPAQASAKAPQEAAQVKEKPKGAADTGEGDVAPVVNAAPAPQEPGSDAGMYVLGGAGLLVAGGAGAFFLRRSRA